jgi:hypothetical protein
MKKENSMNTRRNFIKTFSRAILTGGILGTSGWLLLREPSGEACNFDFPCANCRRLEGCKDAKAKEYKEKIR